MRDLIDERNRREQLKRSVIKRANVHYVTIEELQQQKEAEEKERQRSEAATEAALEMKRRKEMEQQELLEKAKQEAALPPSSFYGMKESDEVTKEQVEAILAEKQGALEKVIEDTKHEKE